MWPDWLVLLLRRLWRKCLTRGGQELPWQTLPSFLAQHMGYKSLAVVDFRPLANVSKSGRRYYVLTLSVNGSDQTYFVKCVKAGRMSRLFYRTPRLASLPIPARVWQGVWCSYAVAVDAYIDAPPLKNFIRATEGQLLMLVAAMANINAQSATLAFARFAWFRKAQPLLHVAPVASKLAQFESLDADLVAKYQQLEPALLLWLRQLPIETINHQDFRPSNVLMKDDQLWIIDWDSARLGPFGLSLWQLTALPLPKRRKLVTHYAACLAQAGYVVAVDELLKRMAVQYLFWCLTRGVAIADARRVERGMILFRDEVLESFA